MADTDPNVENKFREAERFVGAEFSHVSGHQIPTKASVERAKEYLKQDGLSQGEKDIAQAVIDLRKAVEKDNPEVITEDRD